MNGEVVMEEFVLGVERRSETGKGAAGRVRRGGFIPSVVYHSGEAADSISVEKREFVRLAKKSHASQIFRFKLDGDSLDGAAVVVRDLQKHSVSGEVLHVDFQLLRDDRPVKVRVPVSYTGTPLGVKADGGVLSVMSRDVGVSCMPKDIPEIITHDITSLRLSESVHARQIALPERVSLVDDPKETMVTIVAVRSSKRAEDVGEESE